GADIGPYRAWRFTDTYRDPTFAAGLGRETYSDYYRLRFPYDADLHGRPRRLSPLHGRLQEAGAVFGTKAGWERPDHHEPGRPWRRSGRDGATYGWTRPPWFDRVLAEGRAVRERVGIIDLSSFGKVDVIGPGALGLLQRVAANDLDVADGSVVYTPWCDERGGMVADVTVTRLASDHLRVVTGAGFVAGDVAWLRSHRADDEVATIRDVSAEYATIALWGPRARDVLAAATADAVDDGALPLRRAGFVRIGAEAIPTLAARISYAGELGWELTVPAERAVGVWDALWAAGADHDLEPFGYRALDALRMEKGYRYYSTDMTMLETPDEAGLGRFVRLQKGAFIGRQALAQARADGTGVGARARRLTTVYIGEDEVWRPIYGGEAVRADGAVIGRLRSVAYGPCVNRTIATVYLDADDRVDADLTVDVFDDRVPAVVAPDVPWDPKGERMRG
ncbi:MAG TPA: aminomethyltransferase family protein, partial [Candidatus Limnocylindrales bacterium]|nr:aminomethyltransferase family protein [Candidatus Limnocylindrales bacterium]